MGTQNHRTQTAECADCGTQVRINLPLTGLGTFVCGQCLAGRMKTLAAELLAEIES